MNAPLINNMEQALEIQNGSKKIYKDKAIWVGTFLGGPLVAGYFIAENFKVFGEYGKAKKTWIYTVITTIIICGGIFLIPDHIKIPNQIIPIIYTTIAAGLLNYFQGKNIELYIEAGGEVFNWGRIICVGLIGLMVTLIILFSVIFVTDRSGTTETVNTYGVMKHELVFDSDNLTNHEVDKLADILTQTTFFDEEVTKYVYAEKINSTYVISISVVDGTANEDQALQSYKELQAEMERFYPQNKIIINLVVDHLDNIIKKIE